MKGGIDEAGRGPVVGPMVMALVVVDEEGEEELKEIGVKDSKRLGPEKRELLYEEIKKIAEEILVKRIEPFVIDHYVTSSSLNLLEAVVAAELIEGSLSPLKEVYIDAPDVNPERYRETVERALSKRVKVIAEHGADSRYPVVSAASVVAKVERDRIIRRMEEVYGEIGSGYPHDEKTIQFVRKWIKRVGTPSFIRGSWSTVRRIRERSLQRSLDDFF